MIIRNWQEEMGSREQLNLLNAACGDLADQIEWHGFRLAKDDYRHLISGTILGWKMLPGIDRGEGPPGFIFIGGSSLKLNKHQCTDAITLAFLIGDDPESQGIHCQPVRWCQSVCSARWIQEE